MDKKDVTYGLNYYEFMQMIDSKVKSVKDNLNYEIFKSDIETLKNLNNGFGLSSITANNWLKDICNLSKDELKTYVDNYKDGLLIPNFNENEAESEDEPEM